MKLISHKINNKYKKLGKKNLKFTIDYGIFMDLKNEIDLKSTCIFI